MSASRFAFSCRRAVGYLLASAVIWAYPCVAESAETKAKAGAGAAAKSKRAAKPDEEPEEKPKEVRSILTLDGVLIEFDYYPSRVTGMTAATVVMLHDWGRSRRDFDSLALQFQKTGFIVVTVDLRGHGMSRKIADEHKWRGAHRGKKAQWKRLDRRQFDADDIRDMVEDVEMVKWFLVDRRNKKELNIEKLALLGVGMGATVAVRFADRDWSPRYGDDKGWDVHGLALVSPNWVFRRVKISNAFTRLVKLDPERVERIRWPHIYVAVGTQDRLNFRAAERMGKMAHQVSPTYNRLATYRTSLSGHALLGRNPATRSRRDLLKWMIPCVRDRKFGWGLDRTIPPLIANEHLK